MQKHRCFVLIFMYISCHFLPQSELCQYLKIFILFSAKIQICNFHSSFHQPCSYDFIIAAQSYQPKYAKERSRLICFQNINVKLLSLFVEIGDVSDVFSPLGCLPHKPYRSIWRLPAIVSRDSAIPTMAPDAVTTVTHTLTSPGSRLFTTYGVSSSSKKA